MALAGQLVGDVDVLDAFVLGQDSERCGIGGELVISIGEVGVLFVVQSEHGLELFLDLDLDLGDDLIQEGDVVGGLLAPVVERV